MISAHLNANGVPAAYDGPVWTTEEVRELYDVIGFMAPFVAVRRREDGQRGTLTFVHSPRVYFDFVPTT